MKAAIINANKGLDPVIELEDGEYTIWHLNSLPSLTREGIIIRGISGNREKVIIQGDPTRWVTHIFKIKASDITIQDMTLKTVKHHLIQVHGEKDADRLLLRNIRFVDAGQQLVKVTADRKNKITADQGRVENCWFEYTPEGIESYYIGGIDAHFALDWIVRDNIFVGIKSPSEQVAEFAVHFWTNSANTLVERNVIVNCDRGIGFGLGKSRHFGGIIKNNMIFHDKSKGFGDVGIALESAVGALVYNNTIFLEHDYPNAIEYRFPGTKEVVIANNLTNKKIQKRNRGSAEVKNNVTYAKREWFSDPDTGDLHIAKHLHPVSNTGILLEGLILDFDKKVRDFYSGIDIGADEFSLLDNEN